MADDLQQFFESYETAFNALDPDRIARHYHVPSVLQDANGVVVWTTAEDVLANMHALVALYRADDFERAHGALDTRIDLDDRQAFVVIHWTIARANNEPARVFHTAYNVRCTDDGVWRIALCTAYEETA